MRDLFGHPHASRGTVQVAGDNVPPHAPLGQVVQRAHAAGERVGEFVGQRAGHAEPEVFGDHGHRRDHHQRVVDRDLDRVFQRGAAGAFVNVVDAQHVGQEQCVEFAALQCARQIGPVFQRVITVGAIVGMGPQAGRLVPDAVHVEGIQADVFGHQWTFL
jgi:hypothetical protein